jgi:hypothetical protein
MSKMPKVAQFLLMDNPSILGAKLQALLLMNPDKSFILSRSGEILLIED